QGEREQPGLLLDRDHETAVTGDDAKLCPLALALRAGDEQRLVGRGDMPKEHDRLLGFTAGWESRIPSGPTGPPRPRPGDAGRWVRRTGPCRPRSRRAPATATG